MRIAAMALATSLAASTAGAQSLVVGGINTGASFYSGYRFNTHYANGYYWTTFKDGACSAGRLRVYSSANGSTWAQASGSPAFTFCPGEGEWAFRFLGNVIVGFAYNGSNNNRYYRKGTLNSNGSITWQEPEDPSGLPTVATDIKLNAAIVNGKPVLWQADAATPGRVSIGTSLNSPIWNTFVNTTALTTGLPNNGSNGQFSAGAVFPLWAADPNDFIVMRATSAVGATPRGHRVVTIKFHAATNTFDTRWYNVTTLGAATPPTLPEDATTEVSLGTDDVVQSRFAAAQMSDGIIHVVYVNRNGNVLHYRRGTGSLDEPTLDSGDTPLWTQHFDDTSNLDGAANAVDKVGLSVIDGNNLYLFYTRVGSPATLYYRRFDGSAWGLETTIRANVTLNNSFGVMETASGCNAGVAWNEGTGPHNVYFRAVNPACTAPTVFYRSIGTNSDYNTGRVDVTYGSKTVDANSGFPLPAWQTANRGLGDVIVIPCGDPPTCTGGVAYTIALVNTQTRLTLTTAFSGTAGTYTYLIQRQFQSTAGNAAAALTDWEDCIDGGLSGTSCNYAAGGTRPTAHNFNPAAAPAGNLVNANRVEVGVIYRDSFIQPAPSTTGGILFEGAVTSAAHRVVLTATTGNRHNGTPAAPGCTTNCASVVYDGGSLGNNGLVLRQSNVTVQWIEFRAFRGFTAAGPMVLAPVAAFAVSNTRLSTFPFPTGTFTAQGNLLSHLLIQDFDDSDNNVQWNGIRVSGSCCKSLTIRNTMIWDGDRRGIELDEPGETYLIENTTIDYMHGLDSGGSPNARGVDTADSVVIVKNTIATTNTPPNRDFFSPGLGAYSSLSSNNISSDGTAPGANPLTATPAGSLYVAPASPGPANLHLKAAANAAVNSGLDLSSSFVNDIDGQLRPASWDRGADERDPSAPATADLAITKDDSQTTNVPGTSVTYTITVTNNGPATVASVTVNDPLPTKIQAPWLPSASNGFYDVFTEVWTFGTPLAMGNSAVLTLTGTLDPFARGSLLNTATVAPPAVATDPNATNDFASDSDTLDPSADVQVVKTDDLDPAPLGGLLTYTLTVTNNGPSGATSVNVSDPLPPDMDLDAAPFAIVPSQGTCNYIGATRTVSCDLGNLGPTLVATVAIKVRPQALRIFTNTASVTRAEPDPIPANDSESETTTVEVSGIGVRFFTATSTNQRNMLEWINPIDADYFSTEIMVREDTFPTDPNDSLASQVYIGNNGGSGGRWKIAHATGAFSNGQTFYYGAFVHRSPSLPAVSPGRFVTGRPFDHVAGPVKWAFSTGATALAAPTVGEMGVIATSNDKVVYSMKRGIGVDSGEWSASFEPALVGGPVQQRSPVVPLTIGDIVYLGAQNGSIYAIDATAGGSVPYLWARSIGPMVQAAPAGIFGDLGGSLDYLLIGTRDSSGPNAFVALNPSMDDEIARYENTGFGEIGIVNGMAAVDYGPPLPPRVYFTSYTRGSTNTLWCFELKDPVPGPVFSLLWARPLGNIDSSPVLRGGRVYVGSPAGGGTVYSIDALEGDNTALDRTFVHNNGQVRGFVFPDRASTDIYFATDDFVWGVNDTGDATMPDKFGPITLGGGVTPSSAVLFAPGSTYVYVGGSDGKLYELDVSASPPDIKSVTLGDGLATVGAPSLDRVYNLIHVGSEAGIFYAVQVPLPVAACVASCVGQPDGTACEVSPGDQCIDGFVCCSSTCQPSCP